MEEKFFKNFSNSIKTLKEKGLGPKDKDETQQESLIPG